MDRAVSDAEVEVQGGVEPPMSCFADSRLTTWLLNRGVPGGSRTPVTAVRGQRPKPLDDRDKDLQALVRDPYEVPHL